VNPDRDFLLDIIEFIEAIEKHRPETFEDFMNDELVRTATIHWVQTIGGAANGISAELRLKHPDVPWRQIVDMRNLLEMHRDRPVRVSLMHPYEIPRADGQARSRRDQLLAETHQSGLKATWMCVDRHVRPGC